MNIKSVLRLAYNRQCRVFVYGASHDAVHAAHAKFWRAAAASCADENARLGETGHGVYELEGGRTSATTPYLRYTHLAGRTHWGVCSGLYELALHEDESLWHDADTAAARVRARL